MRLLSIIIINYKTKDQTLSAIESLFSSYEEQFKGNTFELIAVDNNSEDNFLEDLKKKYSTKDSIQYIQNDKNFGFAKANNKAVEKTNGQYILFLNSDTEVKDKGFLGMAKFLKNNNDIAILGAKLVNTNGESQPSAGVFYTFINTLLVLLGFERVGMLRSSPKNTQAVDWVSGGALMIKKDAFLKLNGFDEGYFMYIEDMDLCYRGKLLNLKTYFYPEAVVMHKKEGSSNRSFAVVQIYKGIAHFFKMHKSFFEYIIIKTVLMVKAVSLIFVGFITQSRYLKSTYTQALKAL